MMADIDKETRTSQVIYEDDLLKLHHTYSVYCCEKLGINFGVSSGDFLQTKLPFTKHATLFSYIHQRTEKSEKLKPIFY